MSFMGETGGGKYRFTKNNTMLEHSSIFFNTPSEWAKENLLYVEMYGHFVCDGKYRISRGAFDSYLLILTLNGSGTVQTPSGSGVCKKEDIVIIDCNQEHTYYANDKWEFMWIHFNGRCSRELVTALIGRQGNIVHISETSLTSRFFVLTVNLRRMNSIPEEMQVSSYLHLFLAEAMNSRWNERLNGKNHMVSEAIGYIESHYSEKITVWDIAGFVKSSQSAFSHAFQKETGISPYEFIIRKRLDKARELLKTTDDPVSEIAYAVGFQSEANFIKTFRIKTGMTPNAFRKQSVGPL